MHAVILLLLQQEILVISLADFSMLLRDVIVTSYCCQRHAECPVTTLFQAPAGQCTGTPRRARATVELLRQETPNFLASNLWPPTSLDLSFVHYEIWAVTQHGVCHGQIHSVHELKRRRLVDVWCGLKQSMFDETVEC